MVCFYSVKAFLRCSFYYTRYFCMKLFRSLACAVCRILVLIICVRADINSHCISVGDSQCIAVCRHFSAFRHCLQDRIIFHLVVRYFSGKKERISLCHCRAALIGREGDVQVQLVPAFRGKPCHQDIVRIAHKILSGIMCPVYIIIY